MLLEKKIGINPFLLPFSFLYGMGVRFRNQLFYWSVLSTEHYPIPVICIGNLAAGGTGKTPHTEYLIRLLSGTYRVAMVSRGYKRKTSGYILANEQSTGWQIGDEPYQMKKKFPELIVAVDANRRRAITNLLNHPEAERPQVILLDDAFQHRYVQPSLSLLLTDYNRRYYFDRLLPIGRLREPICGRGRADIVVVTKCEPTLKPIEYRMIESNIDLMVHQKLFFTGITYSELEPVFNSKDMPEVAKRTLNSIQKETDVLLVSGIANPTLFIEEVGKHSENLTTMSFPDHHQFKKGDIRKIKEAFNKLTASDKLILVTEKDAARLQDCKEIPEELKAAFYYLPIEIDIRLNQQQQFDEIILSHVDSFRRNRILTL